MSATAELILQASAVAIGGRALALTGPPGCGKSSLALALIDRGAVLIGDDAITLQRDEELGDGARLLALPPPNIPGLLEIHGVGLTEWPVAPPSPLALILDLGQRPERLPEKTPPRSLLGMAIPCLPFDPGSVAPAVRAEQALLRHGLNSK